MEEVKLSTFLFRHSLRGNEHSFLSAVTAVNRFAGYIKLLNSIEDKDPSASVVKIEFIEEIPVIK